MSTSPRVTFDIYLLLQACSDNRKHCDHATSYLDSNFFTADIHKLLWGYVLFASDCRYAFVPPHHSLNFSSSLHEMLIVCTETVVVISCAADPNREAIHDTSSLFHESVNWEHLPIGAGILVVSLSGTFNAIFKLH